MTDKSFARRPGRTVTFDVDGEEFRCVPNPPAAAITDVAISSTQSQGEQVKAIMQYLDLVLDDDSAKRIAERMRDKTNPIDLEVLLDIYRWLLAELSPNRPTGGSSDSPSSSATPTNGSSSTAGALPAMSTP